MRNYDRSTYARLYMHMQKEEGKERRRVACAVVVRNREVADSL